MNYDTIKALAKEHKISAKDLLALAPGNDPFYVGQPSQKEWAQWFSHLWQHLGLGTGVHLRRIHYQIVSQDPPLVTPSGHLYQNTDNDWNTLNTASKWARYLGLIAIDAFVDRRNPEPILNDGFAFGNNQTTPETGIYGQWDDSNYRLPQVPELPKLPETLPALPDFGVSGYEDIQQPFLIEIWAEKTTMNDVLEPLCRRYKANLITGAGELSITAVSKGFFSRLRKANKPARILYISDFDPAGIGMPISVARKIEFELYRQDSTTDIKLEPIVLTPAQIAKFRLPRVPVKDSDKRKDNFQNAYGEGQVELDALEALYPGELAKIVETEILKYYDPTLQRRANRVEASLLTELDNHKQQILAELESKITFIEANYDELLAEFEGTRRQFANLVEGFQEKINLYQDRLEEILSERQNLHYEIAAEMAEVAIDLDNYALPEPNLPLESNGLLYDSNRDYLTQLDAYTKQRKGKTA